MTEPKNLAASIHQKLLNQARTTGRPFNWILCSNLCSNPAHLGKVLSLAVRRAARFLMIKISGIHRLRANCSQIDHQTWMENGGLTDRLARMQVSQKLGHNRIEVVGSYVPVL